MAAPDPAVAQTIRRHEERLLKEPGSLAFAPLADAYRKSGRVQEAIRLCRDGLERFPDYATARLILAKSLLDDGDQAGALTEVRTILAKSPSDAAAHRLAAELERTAGRVPEAVHHLRQAVTLDSADRESKMVLELLDGGKAGGGGPLQRVLADDTFATMSFGTLCLEQGLVDEAGHVFVRILSKHPDHAAARDKLDEAVRIKTQKRKGS